MIHARAPRLAATVVLASAVALAAAACGGPMQAGAAVVVDGHRTTDAQIQSLVTQASAMQTKYGDPSPTPADQLAREQVNWIVIAALYDRAAADLGVTPSAADVAAARADLVQKARETLGSKLTVTDDEAVALNMMMGQQPTNLATSAMPTLYRLQADYAAVTKALSAQPGVTQATAQTALNALLVKTAGEAGVKVSPRYGDFKATAQGVGVGPATLPWIKATATPAAAPPVQG